MENMKDTERKRYVPKQIESMDMNFACFFASVLCVVFELFKVPEIPLWNALGFSLYLLAFPLYAIYYDFKTMCERRCFIEQFFPESYWSNQRAQSDLIAS